MLLSLKVPHLNRAPLSWKISFFGSLTLYIWMWGQYIQKFIVRSRDKGKPFNSGENGIPDVCHSSCLHGRSEAGSGIARVTKMCHSKDSKLRGMAVWRDGSWGRWFISQVPEAINQFHCLSQRALGFPHGSVKAQISSWEAKYCWQHILFEQQHLPHSWQGYRPAEGLIHSPVFAFTWAPVWRSSYFTFSNLWIYLLHQ